jgi:hypothetical protein
MSGDELVRLVLLVENGSRDTEKHCAYLNHAMRPGFPVDLSFPGGAVEQGRTMGAVLPSADLQNVPQVQKAIEVDA